MMVTPTKTAKMSPGPVLTSASGALLRLRVALEPAALDEPREVGRLELLDGVDDFALDEDLLGLVDFPALAVVFLAGCDWLVW